MRNSGRKTETNCKKDRKPGPYPYYGATCIQDYVAGYIFDEPLVLLGEDGAKWGKGDKSAFCVDGKIWVNNHAHVLRPLKVIDSLFLSHTLTILDLQPYITGTTVPKLNQERMCQIHIPLPPLAEQKRIVARIEELFKIADSLDEAADSLEVAAKRLDRKSRNNFGERGGELMPRELMERAADPALVPDEALVAVLLKTGVRGLNVIELARRLIEAFGSMKALVSGDWRTLEARIQDWNTTHPDRPIKGLGHVKCLELAAAFEMGRRWSRLAPDELKAYRVTDPESAYRVFKTVLTPGDDKENLYALLLNNRHYPLCEPLRLSRGTADSAPAFARDVFKEAIRWGAVALMVAHNHPSGDPTPSKADFAFTERLVALARIAEMRFLDHLVLGDAGYASIRSLAPSLFK